ncbi:MAG: cell division protein FtsQ/DivIB [Streptosporangiaceae bacterium]
MTGPRSPSSRTPAGGSPAGRAPGGSGPGGSGPGGSRAAAGPAAGARSAAARSTAARSTGGTAPAADRGPGAAASTRRPGRRWKLAFFIVALVAIVGGAAWLLLGSSLLVVRSVAVTGARPALREQVLRAAGIATGTPLIKVNTAQAARQVEQLTLVQSAQVRRDWPDGVTITVRPRTAVFAVASGGQYEVVDRFGVVLWSAAARPAGPPLLRALPPGPLRGSAEVRAAAGVLRALPGTLRRRLTAVSAPAAGQVALRLRGGVTINWGSPADQAAKAAELRILMRRRATYYDVSDPASAVTSG